VHTMTGGYVADALSPAERERFERHLDACGACAQEVRELQETAARLGGAAAARVPAGLRDQVMAEIRQTRQLPPVSGRPYDPARAPARPRLQRWLIGAAACLAVIALGLGAATARLYQDLQQARETADRVTAALLAPDARAVAASSGGGIGTVVVSRQRGTIVFLARGLPDVPNTRTYQLWMLGPEGPRPAGVLPLSNGEIAPHLTQAPGDTEAVALTVEPAGGSEKPTTDPVLVVRLPKI